MIEFNKVSKSFGNVNALDSVSFILEKGNITGLFGPNGAGKSTIMKIIAGLNRVDAGAVIIDGQTPAKAKNIVAYLPEIDHLYNYWTMQQAAQFMQSFYADWDQQRYADLLRFLQIDNSWKLGKISKGQRAKAKLALALARKAPYLMLDEPFSGIDLVTREEIVAALIRDYGEGEQSILISTHEIDEIESLIDKVIFIDGGRIQLAGDVEEMRQQRGASLVEIVKEVFRSANR